MINLLTIILLIFIYIIDTLFILSFYQQDNYHLRIIINQIKKHFLTEIYKLIFFIYLLINKIAILPLLLIYILLIYTFI